MDDVERLQSIDNQNGVEIVLGECGLLGVKDVNAQWGEEVLAYIVESLAVRSLGGDDLIEGLIATAAFLCDVRAPVLLVMRRRERKRERGRKEERKEKVNIEREREKT